jgi:2-polyprenyl-6-methoxyphenol hydroxylase-like FAD-dependent oxidoreductase
MQERSAVRTLSLCATYVATRSFNVARNFEYEVLSKEDWIGRRLVANRFQKGRAFICGDAAHLWIPHARYGMNAGIADAANLSWMAGGT